MCLSFGCCRVMPSGGAMWTSRARLGRGRHSGWAGARYRMRTEEGITVGNENQNGLAKPQSVARLKAGNRACQVGALDKQEKVTSLGSLTLVCKAPVRQSRGSRIAAEGTTLSKLKERCLARQGAASTSVSPAKLIGESHHL